MRIHFLFFLLSLFIAKVVAGQNPVQEFSFVSHPKQQYGFDPCHYKEWEKHHIQKKNESGINLCVDNKAVGFLEIDVVTFLFNEISNPQKLSFEYGQGKKIPFQLDSDTSATLYLPRERNNYLVAAKLEDKIVSYLNVKVYKPIVQEVQIVLLNDEQVDIELIENYLDSVYHQCNFQLKLLPPILYKDSILHNVLLDNPSYQNDRYTRQMREFRDRFFEGDPYTKNKYYLFVINGFVNKSRIGYMPKNKAFGFVKSQESPRFEITIARQLGFGVGILDNAWSNNGPSRGSTLNLMDINGGTELTMDQWDDLHRYYKNHLFYDGDEDVITNNGMVAYYFWEEDAQGNILAADSALLNALKRPYKKNYRSYHLNIQDQLFEIVFQYKTILICWLHIILWGFLFLVFIIVRAVVKRRWKKNLTSYTRRKMIKWAVGSVTILLSYFGYYLIGFQLDKYQVISGHIKEFDEFGYYAVNRSILQNEFLRDNAERNLSTEILIKKGNEWYIKQRKKVLYFDAKQTAEGKIFELKFVSDNDNLILKHHQYLRPASSHYMVVNYYSPNDSFIDQRVYNHLGIDLTSKLSLNDATKRILVFVNGYRPASTGHSFEENFIDIQKNGFEFPNSSNLIYNYDRFNYWRPWKAIDEKFIKRINPSETYYADGHFSVETSNHGSIYSFSSLSSAYPRRCKNSKKHTCYNQKVKSLGLYGDKVVKTKDLLPRRSNQPGFDLRVNNGKIAGRNLLVMLNEIPNRSVNDTLFIVAHSMGYAYSLGIIEELRGKIAFGGYYIISPENASAGKVKLDEWGQVWQYGSDFIVDAPCLQDGVAPQTCAGGLSENERVYIPENLHYRKGFFDSHFIGYYEWIFNIPEGKKGRILQH